MADGGRTDLGPLVRRIRMQADACRDLGSPLYDHLLHRVADDVLAGGPAREVLRGHEDDAGPTGLALRLMGGVHRLVLERRAPALALTYPSVGGSGDRDAAWTALRDVLADRADEIRPWLDRPPQTNEVGRAAVLVGTLLHLLEAHPAPVRLVEIGASAGLNLRADRFRLELADGRGLGPADSPVRLPDPWRGPVPPLRPVIEVVERSGCDVAPVDPTTTAGRLLLTSYVWPDQSERLERLRGAFAVAAAVPATVETSGAADFLGRLQLVEGQHTVLWHSVMWQYLEPVERSRADARITELGDQATPTTPFTRIAMEPRRRTPDREHEFLVTLQTWPGGGERVLGGAHPHGMPATWE